MSVSVDTSKAEQVLDREWRNVIESNENNYIEDENIKEKISEIFQDDRYGVQTFKYILLSNVLAKAVHPEIHYRAIQTESDLEESFSSRTIAEQVVVDWEQENGERLGGSNEPGTSKPFRWPEISEEIQVMRDEVLEKLIDLLNRLEEKTSHNEIKPINVLKQCLNEVAKLESQTINYNPQIDSSFYEFKKSILDYLATTGGGERLAAVTAGIIKASYPEQENLEINTEQVNIPDSQSNSAGDIEVFRDEELQTAFEVKDKPVELNDLNYSVKKARKNKLDRYYYIVGDGFQNLSREKALEAARDSPIDLVIVEKKEIISWLKLMEHKDCRRCLNYVSDYLNQMRAQEKNKEEWVEAMEKIGDEK